MGPVCLPRSGLPRQGGARLKVAVAHARATGEGDIPDHDFRVTAADGTQRTVAMRAGCCLGTTSSSRLWTVPSSRRKLPAAQPAYMDALTHLANRRHFDQALQAEAPLPPQPVSHWRW